MFAHIHGEHTLKISRFSVELDSYIPTLLSSKLWQTTSNNDSDSPKGIFVWDKTFIESLNKCEKDGVMTLKDKQLHMVAYLLELGYELMYNAGMDVSTMPGFERFSLPNLNRK
jgi:hypothetical protein